MTGPAGGGTFYVLPTGTTNAQTFPIRFRYPDPYTRLNPTGVTDKVYDDWIINDKALLILMLMDSRARNFFFDGHGSADSIAGITTDSIRKYFTPHRYRFVWLNACLTGNGSLPELFGIKGPGIFSLQYYAERTKRPALFVGNKYETPIGVSSPYTVNGLDYRGYIPRCMGEFYIQFVFYWQTMNRQYWLAVQNAQDLVRGAYFDKYLGYFPGDNQVRIGYEDMRYNEYNTAGDIPRP